MKRTPTKPSGSSVGSRELNVTENLNPRQIDAVRHVEGPILVLAGAGSGKTRVLIQRIVNLILRHDVRPEEILAVTFTNKACEEMRKRLESILGESCERLWISTFHSAGLRILRRHATKLGYQQKFSIYDDKDSTGLIKQILKQRGMDPKGWRELARYLDRCKNNLLTPDQAEKEVTSVYSQDNAEMYHSYQEELMRANAMDFGDLLMNSVLLLQQFPEVRKIYKNHLRFLLVDEFQDTNKAQYVLLRLMCGAHNNLFVVGDDDQSIYAFRGATIQNILSFEKDYPDTQVVTLDQNYRSTKTILSAAHAVIERNSQRRDKELWTENESGELLATYIGADETVEADFVVTTVQTLQAQGMSLTDIACFYRTNAQSRALEESLVQAGIPYRIYGALKFYDRKEIKDIVAYLRLVSSSSDNQAFLRIVNTPPRGIGAQSIRTITQVAYDNSCSLFEAARILLGDPARRMGKLQSFVELIQNIRKKAKTVALSELIEYVVRESEYGPKLEAMKDDQARSRLENLKELAAIARASYLSVGSIDAADEHMDRPNATSQPALDVAQSTLQPFLDRISLSTSDEQPSQHGTPQHNRAPQHDQSNAEEAEQAQFVTLMTLHLAKGLEFPAVFITGLEEGLLPHSRSMDDPTQLEEERRLCYVGITRARQKLFLTRARTRGMFASGGGFGSSGYYREPSRFIRDIPPELLDDPSGEFTESWQLDYDDNDIGWG